MSVEAVTLRAARLELQRVATHILARRRHAACGRFGLRATPGGIGTPAFGPSDAIEVLRTSGSFLVHEVGPELRVVPMDGATLADLAAECRRSTWPATSPWASDTPTVGDVERPDPTRRRRRRRAG